MHNPQERSDDVLVAGYLKGDLAAFDEIYARYRDRLFAYASRSVGHDQAAEVFQDIWVKVLVGVRRYRSNGRFRSWLFACAHNVIVDYYRKVSADRSESLGFEPGSLDKENDEDLASRIETALWQLPGEQRQAFYLREELSCAVREIADIQGCSVEAAKSRLRYAYAKLRDLLEDLEP